ncbi:hypothetical protein AALT52_01520 [Ligilactobacillus faecis]|uniref:Uncharacterized protein n=1 Tax=Ligilactobacillus faecis TaxID=762833 RepID=A0ABV4DM74_9LACO
MSEEERKELKETIRANCGYFYAQVDGTYHIPHTIEGQFVALMLQVFYDFPKDRIIYYNLKNPDELFDADGHPVRELSGYVRIDEE